MHEREKDSTSSRKERKERRPPITIDVTQEKACDRSSFAESNRSGAAGGELKSFI